MHAWIREHGGRSVIKSRTAYMQPCSVVVVRYGIGRGSRVVVSWHGAWVTAAVLTLDEADDLIAAIQRAKSPVRDQG